MKTSLIPILLAAALLAAIPAAFPAPAGAGIPPSLLAAAPGAGGPAAGAEDASPTLVPQRIYSAREALAPAPAEPGMGSGVSMSPGAGAKNHKLAMLYSLLLPGMGEAYLGHSTRAKGFLVAEGGIWTSFFVFRSQGAHRKDLYREYAKVNAGVAERNDDEFYRIVGNYISSDGPFSANEQVRRDARALYPNDRAAQDAYYAENAYAGDDTWTWNTADELIRFQELRKSSLDAYHRRDLSIGLMVANRLLSVLDVGILAARSTRDGDHASLSWGLDAGPDGPGGRVVLARSF